MEFWLPLLIHTLVNEIYLWLTPAEAERLRLRSYESNWTEKYWKFWSDKRQMG